VQNAILGPLRDKRVATIQRIEIAIGRHAAKPTGLENTLATCSLSTAAAATTTAAAPPAGNGNGTAAAVGTITCPDVAGALPAVPAPAQAEVTSNLALLQKQIAEANARLVSSVGQGGAAFVQNAILGPLRDKRVATIQRIEIAIGRHATKPTGQENTLATCSLSG
jgi:hypothetical protein